MRSFTARRAAKVTAGLLALSTALALSGCGGGASSTPTSTSKITGNVAELSGADPKALGKGLTIPVGLDVALSGQGSYYGKVMSDAAKLAAAQIEAAGGPKFNIVLKDNKSGDTQAGVQTTRELGQQGTHLALYSFIGVFGSAFQGIDQYKILSLDGGGGTSTSGKSKPWFYGTRANTPHDSYPGVARYISQALPKVKRVAAIIQDAGAGFASSAENILRTELSKYGIQLVDVEVAANGATDDTAAISKMLAANPDLIVQSQFGTDVGYTLKQLRAAGSNLPVIGSEFLPDLANIAGKDAVNNYMFANDFFDAKTAPSAWGKYFVKTWEEAYPNAGAPDFYAANYYEDLFVLWQVVQRVTAKGGDVNNPDDLKAAFESNLTFPSVYGHADGKNYGTFSIDPTTHSVSSRQITLLQYQKDQLTPLAQFGIGAADFNLLTK
ncbi:branched-chain amino acid transport system substrate-binding protein [Arthrobacter sp. GAS37]|uniref:ABC transporter substrate-binding protein n=1 Tax=Arthrobacter sp. GAS37 TaxID=3156261 RepID=UPI00383480DD